MKPTANFKMSSTTKNMLSAGRFRNKEDRDGFRRAMVQAELKAKDVDRFTFGKPSKNEE